jgi:hypothetical protein
MGLPAPDLGQAKAITSECDSACASQQKLRADVADGVHKQTFTPSLGQVRFTPRKRTSIGAGGVRKPRPHRHPHG